VSRSETGGHIPGVEVRNAGISDWDLARDRPAGECWDEHRAADMWLREHDPALTVDGKLAKLEAETVEALAVEDLSLDQVRAAFPKSGGAPTKELRELRRCIRYAMQLLWEDRERRDLLARVLGCHRVTLYRLMEGDAAPGVPAWRAGGC
jgi:hypothetical protein